MRVYSYKRICSWICKFFLYKSLPVLRRQGKTRVGLRRPIILIFVKNYSFIIHRSKSQLHIALSTKIYQKQVNTLVIGSYSKDANQGTRAHDEFVNQILQNLDERLSADAQSDRP